jgi:hypothetical protein
MRAGVLDDVPQRAGKAAEDNRGRGFALVIEPKWAENGTEMPPARGGSSATGVMLNRFRVRGRKEGKTEAGIRGGTQCNPGVCFAPTVLGRRLPGDLNQRVPFATILIPSGQYPLCPSATWVARGRREGTTWVGFFSPTQSDGRNECGVWHECGGQETKRGMWDSPEPTRRRVRDCVNCADGPGRIRRYAGRAGPAYAGSRRLRRPGP